MVVVIAVGCSGSVMPGPDAGVDAAPSARIGDACDAEREQVCGADAGWCFSPTGSQMGICRAFCLDPSGGPSACPSGQVAAFGMSTVCVCVPT